MEYFQYAIYHHQAGDHCVVFHPELAIHHVTPVIGDKVLTYYDIGMGAVSLYDCPLTVINDNGIPHPKLTHLLTEFTYIVVETPDGVHVPMIFTHLEDPLNKYPTLSRYPVHSVGRCRITRHAKGMDATTIYNDCTFEIAPVDGCHVGPNDGDQYLLESLLFGTFSVPK
jgi:hypothetical protein